MSLDSTVISNVELLNLEPREGRLWLERGQRDVLLPVVLWNSKLHFVRLASRNFFEAA
jgi:hypothetical protein